VENIIIKFVADTSGLEPAIKQLQLLGKITDEDAAKFNAINQEQKEFIQNVNKSATEFGKLSNEVGNLSAEIQGGVMNTLADGLKEVTGETVNSAKGFKSMKAELRELKAQIASGTLGEKEMQAATRRAGELADAIEDAGRQVKAFAGSRFENVLNRVSEGAKALAAGMTMVAGAQALLGSENKDLEKAMLKVQASMALLQGTQELTNLLQKESALMTGLMEVKTYALATAQRVAAATSTALGVSISQSMVLATGGLAALGIGLVALMSTMDDASENAKKKHEEFLERHKNDEDILEQLDEARVKRTLNGRAQELALQKIHNQKMLDELSKKNMDEDLQNKMVMELAYQNRQAIDDINKKYDDKEKQDAEDAAKDREKIQQENYKRLLEQLKKYREDRERLMAEMKQASIDMDNAEVTDKINARKKDQSDFELNLQTQLASQFSANKAEIDAFFKMMADKQAAREKEKQTMKELAQFTIDQARVVTDTIFTIGQQNRQAEFDAEIEQLNRLRENELANKNLTEAQRAQIEKRYAQEEAKLKRQAWEQQKAADLAQAIINTALAVTKSFATLGYPAGIPGAVGAGIAGAAQIAVIANTKPPKFADGTEFLVGAGTGRSDNNLAYLSHGERVVPAAVNSDYFPALSAIHNREVEPTFANNILTALANGTFELAAQYQSAQGSSKKSLDYDKLGKVLERNKSNVNINIDENGFNKYVEKMHNRTEFRNSKMRIKV
jgi:hypothetical protein